MALKLKFYQVVLFIVPLLLVSIVSCNSQNQEAQEDQVIVEMVTTSGIEDDYTFSVTLRSPDLGCQQYADWWEVITVDGKLIYRRILTHSHVNEQPFTRSGGKVKINANQEVIVRAHMNNTGYGVQAMIGTIKSGFQTRLLEKDFAELLESTEPLPDGCTH